MKPKIAKRYYFLKVSLLFVIILFAISIIISSFAIVTTPISSSSIVLGTNILVSIYVTKMLVQAKKSIDNLINLKRQEIIEASQL